MPAGPLPKRVDSWNAVENRARREKERARREKEQWSSSRALEAAHAVELEEAQAAGAGRAAEFQAEHVRFAAAAAEALAEALAEAKAELASSKAKIECKRHKAIRRVRAPSQGTHATP